MSTYYVAPAAAGLRGGDDAHDGRDNLGLGLVATDVLRYFNGTWSLETNTGPWADRGYSYTAGDLLYISAPTWSARFAITGAHEAYIYLSLAATISGTVPTTETIAWTSSSTGPWATIQHAIGTVSAASHVIMAKAGTYAEGSYLNCGNTAFPTGKQLTIMAVGGTVEITSSGGYHVRVSATTSNTSVIFAGVKCASAKAQLVYVDGTMPVTFVDPDFVATSYYGIYVAKAGSNVTVAGGSITTAMHCVTSSVMGNLTINAGCHLTWGSGDAYTSAVSRTGACGTVTLDGIVVTSTSGNMGGLFGGSPTAYTTKLVVNNCTSSGNVGAILDARQAVTAVEYTNNTIATAASFKTLAFGIERVAESPDPQVEQTNAYPLGSVKMSGNLTIYTSAAATHLLLLASGADGTQITDNWFVAPSSTAEYCGFVIKDDDAFIRRNFVYGAKRACFLAGGSRADVQFNTFVATTGTAVEIDRHQDYSFASGSIDGTDLTGHAVDCVFRNNICVSADSYALSIDPNNRADNVWPASEWRFDADYNCYWTGGANVLRIGPTNVALSGVTPASVNATWAAWAKDGTVTESNDLHSIFGDPGFLSIDPESVDFLHVDRTSIVRRASSTPTTPGAHEIGAYQLPGRSVMLGGKLLWGAQ